MRRDFPEQQRHAAETMTKTTRYAADNDNDLDFTDATHGDNIARSTP